MKNQLNELLRSLKSNSKGIALMIVSAVFSCIGQLFWKIGTDKGFLYILIGLIFYAVAAVFMILSYRHGRLSVLQPTLSVSYALSIVLAAVFLNEPVTVAKVAGVLLIIAGVILIGGGEAND